jgi:serine O-acetyltransferase
LTENQIIHEDLKRWSYLQTNKNPGRIAFIRVFLSVREFRAVYLFRKLHHHKTAKHKLRHMFWTLIKFFSNNTVYIDEDAQIGPGMQILHPFGISIGAAIIGKNFTIHQNASVGANYKIDDKGRRYPTLGDNVRMSPCSHILGPVNVGSNVLVAANAVLTRDCGSNCVMGGIPAKIIGKYDSERFDAY